MKIKRFFASEMREAIRQVKEELGADAVILSNNKVDGGIELVAAIDYDEETVQRHADSHHHQQSTSTNDSPKRKKRSVYAKVRKQVTKTQLEDSIEDDVISFSHAHLSGKKQIKKQEIAPEKLSPNTPDAFSTLLKQSTENQSARNQNARNQNARNQSARNQSARAKMAGSLKKEADVYSKPSLQERKQPYISEFNSLDDDFEQNIDPADIQPFDYEDLVKGKQSSQTATLQRESRIANNESDWDMDSFFLEPESGLESEPGSRPAKNKKQNKNKNQSHRSSKSVEWVQDPALTSMHEEIRSLRGILENQLSGLAWGDFSRRNPHHAELLSRLYRLGIKSSLSEKLLKQLKKDDSLEDSWRRLLSILARNIPVVSQDPLDEGGVIALVGPTGVGKTTNIAKLAARFTLKHGAKNLALVTTDNYRVGAHEQLKTYGRILGVPVYVANDETELKQALSRLDDKKLVLIDTAGMSHRDLRLTQQLSMLRRSHSNMKILAVLSAASQTLAMDEIIKTFKASELDGCIASKVDESTSIGGIISILIENQLQLNYISDGQKVPEDIHRANTKTLLKQALEMVRQHPVQVRSDELAMSYSVGGLSHAVG